MVRTAALWGVGTRIANGEALLHDGSAQTIEDTILRHRNSAAAEAEAFDRLDEEDTARLLLFLESLQVATLDECPNGQKRSFATA